MTRLGACLKRQVDRYCGKTPRDVRVEEALGITVAEFSDVPSPGLVTDLTIGLSAHRLDQKVGKRPIRHELLTCVDQAYARLPWAEVLMAVGKSVIEEGVALERGQVLGPAGPLFPEDKSATVSALLGSSPAFFPAEFGEFECEGETLVIVELIPITETEAAWIQRRGWSAFFDRVNEGDLDISNIRRDAVPTLT